MTIDRIRLEHFQCHELLEVKLDPKITTIVGPSDVGKSAVIRALRWLATNKPRGNGFLKRGEEEVVVEVGVDGGSIRRERSNSENSYAVGQVRYKAFGNDVPPDMVKVLRLGPNNFSGQHDSPFWFSLTGGELAKELNQIVDLEIIDDSLSRLASRTRSLRASEGVLSLRIQEAKERSRGLSWAVLADGELARLEEAREKIEKLRWRVESLGKILEEVSVAEEAVKRPVPDLSPLEVKRKKALALSSSIERLSLLVARIEDQEEVVTDAARLAASTAAELKKELGGKCPLCGGKMS